MFEMFMSGCKEDGFPPVKRGMATFMQDNYAPEHELERAQQALEPKESLAPYAGHWVALRDGRVIASDLDAALLLGHPDVAETDVLVPVARLKGSYFVA